MPHFQVDSANHFDSLQKWLIWLKNYHPESHIDMELDRVKRVTQKILHKKKLAECIVTIAGTNGKGSTVAILESIAAQADLTFGTLTSPHFFRFNERIKINGKPVTDDLICDAFNTVDQLRAQKGVVLTYFEYMVVVAFEIFTRYKLDAVFLEIGMGGRLDAVNSVDSDIAVITTIALDHQDYLGETIAKIAKEKAAICRAKNPIIIGDFQQINHLTAIVKNAGAIPLTRGTDFDITFNEKERLIFSAIPCYNPSCYQTVEAVEVKIEPSSMTTMLPLTSVACALQTVLLKPFPEITLEAMTQGVQKAKLMGRMQMIELTTTINGSKKCVSILLDVAHNPQAAHHLAGRLKLLRSKQYSTISSVFAVYGNKDYKGIIQALSDSVDQWFTAPIPEKRGLSAHKLNKTMDECHQSFYAFSSITQALSQAILRAKQNELILVTGSFYAVAAALSQLSHHVPANELSTDKNGANTKQSNEVLT